MLVGQPRPGVSIRTADIKQAGSTTAPRSGDGDRPQGDPEGVRREAPNNPSRAARLINSLRFFLLNLPRHSRAGSDPSRAAQSLNQPLTLAARPNRGPAANPSAGGAMDYAVAARQSEVVKRLSVASRPAEGRLGGVGPETGARSKQVSVVREHRTLRSMRRGLAVLRDRAGALRLEG